MKTKLSKCFIDSMAVLKKLTIRGFRCYENSTVAFQPTSILVGRNNAGKSTLIEALKIISVISRKYRTAHFISPPAWLIGETDNGISPSIDRIGISGEGIFYMYRNSQALIEASFSNGSSIKAYIGEYLSVFALIIGRNGQPARNSKEAKSVIIPTVEVLPQISAVLDTEILISKETVDINMPTRLTSRNFRNQLYYYKGLFPRFKELAEQTWEHLQIKPIESTLLDKGRTLQFYVRDNSFESEIAWMGHGLQMWLQTMWFVSRCGRDSIVVLDEPDVYMHADLQRRLVRFVAPMFSQLIIATHSIEILEEVTANSVIPVDSRRRQIKPIGDHVLLQQLAEEMGSSLNLDLSRLFLSKRFLIWEGEDTDRRILSAFQSVLSPMDIHPISSFPKVYVEGWGGWQRALAVAEVFNQNKIDIKCYCVFDSDYHLEEDIHQRQEEAQGRGVNLHIWHRKEIENYAINEDVILRYITRHKRKGQVSAQVLQEKLFEIASSMEQEFYADVADEIRMKDHKLSVKTALEAAKNLVANKWKRDPFCVLPGKTVIKSLSAWSHMTFGVAFDALDLVHEFQPKEVPEEIRNVIDIIIEGRAFDTASARIK